MQEKRKFTLGETIAIKVVLGMTDAEYVDIFLSETSHIRDDASA